MISLGVSSLLVALLATCAAGKDVINSNLVNREVSRTIDLRTHVAHVSTSFTLENTGSQPATSFHFAIDAAHAKTAAHIGATVSGEGDNTDLSVNENVQTDSTSDATFARINLASPLASGKRVTVVVNAVFPGIVSPYPSAISQNEKQLVQFTGNHYVLSPYKTDSQTTTVQLPNKNIESMTRLQPASVSDDKLKYGAYENVDAMRSDEMVVHYENNSPFLSIAEMDRAIEVSHWGNIAVEETLDLVHTGATLKGSFSRYDFQRNPTGSGLSAVQSFKTILPAAARDVYYRDEIGNISTSHLLEKSDSVELELRPRFPLFGGWKTHYFIGYNVPTYEYLMRAGDQYKLTMRVIDHVYDDQHVQNFKLRITLPEGCKNIKVKTPYTMKEQPRTVMYTYLDTVGRPVVTLEKSNLVQDHIQDFVLTYEFQSSSMLQEPLLVVGFFFSLFVAVIISTYIF